MVARVSKCLGLFALLWAGVVLLAAFASQAPPNRQRTAESPSSATTEESSKLEPLRNRVEEFYGFLQLGQWSQAENCLTEESKESFRQEKKGPLLSFTIGSVKLDQDGQGAAVVVRIQTFTKFSPVTLDRTSRWVLAKGTWYLSAPPPDLKEHNLPLFENRPSRRSAPPPEELKFKGHRYTLGKIITGDVKLVRFPFTNVTDHLVKIAEVITGCDCLLLKTEKKEYKPGESGELIIEFNTTGYEQIYGQSITVKTDPGGLTTLLSIWGLITPAPAPEDKPAAKPPS